MVRLNEFGTSIRQHQPVSGDPSQRRTIEEPTSGLFLMIGIDDPRTFEVLLPPPAKSSAALARRLDGAHSVRVLEHARIIS
jgi:hypothetical protein